MKKLVSLLLALGCLFPLGGFAACIDLSAIPFIKSSSSIEENSSNGENLSDSGTEGLAYTLSDDESYYICSGIGSATATDIVIADVYNGLSVKEIADNAFENNSNLTSVTIGGGVTSIGLLAFYYCSNLTSVSIPDSVTSIEAAAFSFCNSLTDITIPNGVTSIEPATFYDCSSLTAITIPDSVTSIGYEAFNYCSSLTSIAIPYGVTSMEDFVFWGCSSLTSINIPDSVTSIGEYAFDGCNGLTSVYYQGAESEWAKISMDDFNSPLISATKYYYSESAPTDGDNYWHYVDGVPTVW